MAYIYMADIYCDSCGEKLKEELDCLGETPKDPEDHYSYDSDYYPKWCSDDEESDSPQHCGNHERCLEAVELPSGRKIGALISTSLTSEGVDYLKDMVSEGGEVADFWKEEFDWVDWD